MQLAEKKIKEYGFKIEGKKETLAEAEDLLKQQKKALDAKEGIEIVSETEKERDFIERI